MDGAERDETGSVSEHTLPVGGPPQAGTLKIADGFFQLGSIVGGSYRLKAIVGRGGMGVVYLAEHILIEREYALKALAPDQLTESNWQRFQSEGKAIARLDHPNIVKVYDMGIDGASSLYYVMEFLHGQPLSDFIKSNGSLTLDQCIEVFSQISAGLGYAHEHGIIHRDVKPSNIMLTGSPLTVKIVDFGVAKLVGKMSAISQSQTSTGEVFGSPYYMSPEQCIGAKIDERSDIYSLGCALFECLTGQPPFCGESAIQTVMMHQNQNPPLLASVGPENCYPPALEELVALMLKKRPPERPQSMSDVINRLARLKEGKSIRPEAIFIDQPPMVLDPDAEPVSEKRNFVLLALLLCIFAIIGAGFWALNHYVWSRSHTRPEVLENSSVTSTIAQQKQLTIKHCRPISDGVSEVNGVSSRVFQFPTGLSIGTIIAVQPPTTAAGQFWSSAPKIAAGTIVFPESEKVTLRVSTVEGKDTLLYPQILSLIGADDIDRLEFDAGAHDLEELKPVVINAIAGWSGLKYLKIDGFKLPSETLLALNNIHAVEVLNLRGSLVDGRELIKVKWLNQIETLDLKEMKNIDLVFQKLSGSKSLHSLYADNTNPSLDALRALSSCTGLQVLSLHCCEIDDQKMEAICAIPNLRYVSLNDNVIAGQSAKYLAKMKHLRQASLKNNDGMTENDFRWLRQERPDCSFVDR